MITLPEFFYIPPDLIESTKDPFYLARIIKFSNEFELQNYVNESQALANEQIFGYSILLSFEGSLQGYKIRINSPTWGKDLQNLFEKMAHWFLTEKINKNLKYYKKYETTKNNR